MIIVKRFLDEELDDEKSEIVIISPGFHEEVKSMVENYMNKYNYITIDKKTGKTFLNTKEK